MNTLLTRFLRVHCHLSRRATREDDADRETFLNIQREKCLRRLQQYELGEWSALHAALLETCDSKGISLKEVNDRVKDIQNIARTLLGPLSGSSNMVDAVSFFLVQMIHDSYFIHHIIGTTADHRDSLCSLFDPSLVTPGLLNKVYEHSKVFFQILKDTDYFSFFFANQSAILSGDDDDPHSPSTEAVGASPNTAAPNGPIFGLNLPIDCDIFTEPPQPFLEWESEVEEEERKKKSITDGFSMAYRDPKNTIEEDADSDTSSDDEEDVFSVAWLHESLHPVTVDLGLSIDDVMEMVRTSVCDDSKSRLVLEQDLLSLMGIQHIALIRDIVSHRGELTNSFECLYQDDSQKTLQDGSHPTIDYKSLLQKAKQYKSLPGQSIIVQTEEEKKLFKLARKAEKKLKRERKNQQQAKNSGGKQLTQADIQRMQEKRAEQLINAMAAPLFKKANQAPSTPQPTYEYVFDNYQEAKQTASFVAGCKMILPVGFKRSDDPKWEEMTIPAPSKPPEEIISKFPLIQVSSLDEVAKVGFSGVTRLNQIQSIVFNTAYNTNENMLVCAPTGAGKTNIALLTILREVKNNITEDGTLRLNDFKIIYIAPMKALVAEMVENFAKKLKAFGIRVRELTGDMQMTKAEIATTQMIITTPEKWDVITRKTSGVQLLQMVKLTIIDEVHLLESDRGPVLEALVSRIIRNVESTQQMSRLVGLSATLPNYVDVAEFLGVSLQKGLFMFDSRFRPVPLELSFVGVKAVKSSDQAADMDEVCYEKVRTLVTQGHQVMIFVHSRNATYRVATKLFEEASSRGETNKFAFEDSMVTEVAKCIRNTRNKQLVELLQQGFAIHHAGLLRQDRNMVENLFREGGIRVLCCTATLAWGVNLPAHAVIIRGTEVYDPGHGTFIDLSMLDVMQIFGRAGRPQYDTSGFACIITNHDKLAHYLSMLTSQFPIESNFLKFVTDNLNAEIVSATVSDVTEGTFWLRYTYLAVRMKKNPLQYGMSYEDLRRDPHLQEKLRDLIISSARELHSAKMIEFNEKYETFRPTDLGRTASHYYIKYDTIVIYNERLDDDMPEDYLLRMLCYSQEFDQLKTREEEIEELMFLLNTFCRLKVPDSVDSKEGKVNILIQTYLSRGRIETFSLSSDASYVAQNVVRLVRGLFEYSRKSKWSLLAHKTLLLSKMLDKKMWNFESPFRQLSKREVDEDVLKRMDNNIRLSPARLKTDELSAEEIGRFVRNAAKGKVLKEAAHWFPALKLAVKPTIINDFGNIFQVLVEIEYTPDFKWNDFYHGKLQGFWFWLYDPETCNILHSDYIILAKAQVQEKKPITISFRMAIHPSVTHFVLHVDSDYWLGCDMEIPIPLDSPNDATGETTKEVISEMSTAFKEQQQVADITSNVRITQRVRDREVKMDKTSYAKKQEAIKLAATSGRGGGRGGGNGGRRGGGRR